MTRIFTFSPFGKKFFLHKIKEKKFAQKSIDCSIDGATGTWCENQISYEYLFENNTEEVIQC